MKNYIVPELEVTSFKAVDILTTSGDPAPIVNLTGNESNTISAAADITFSNNGAF